MTDLAKFIENEQIPSHLIWIYNRDSDGKKTPTWEKNTADDEEIEAKRKKHVYISKNPPKNITETEKQTLYLAHTLFLKRTDTYFASTLMMKL